MLKSFKNIGPDSVNMSPGFIQVNDIITFARKLTNIITILDSYLFPSPLFRCRLHSGFFRPNYLFSLIFCYGERPQTEEEEGDGKSVPGFARKPCHS